MDVPGDIGVLREIHSRVIPAPRSIPARIKPITPRMIQVSDFENADWPVAGGASFTALEEDASLWTKREDAGLSEISGCTRRQ